MTSIRKASLPSAAIAIPLLVAVGLAVFATATLGAIAGMAAACFRFLAPAIARRARVALPGGAGSLDVAVTTEEN